MNDKCVKCGESMDIQKLFYVAGGDREDPICAPCLADEYLSFRALTQRLVDALERETIKAHAEYKSGYDAGYGIAMMGMAKERRTV